MRVISFSQTLDRRAAQLNWRSVAQAKKLAHHLFDCVVRNEIDILKDPLERSRGLFVNVALGSGQKLQLAFVLEQIEQQTIRV